MTYSTKQRQLRRDIIGSLNNKMLGTSLWGVLDITLNKHRYQIIEIVEELISENFYKEYGFTLKMIDGMNFVQKIPFFDNNDSFILAKDLYIGGRPSYQAYLAYMNKEQLKHSS